MYYVYLLENKNDKGWYIGYSTHLKRRLKEHQEGYGSKTTSIRNGWVLIYYEAYVNDKDAKGRERFLKSGSGRRFLKKQIINYLSDDS